MERFRGGAPSAARASEGEGSFPPVYVISLQGATERRRHIQATLRAQGVEPMIVDAVDGRELTDEQRRLYDPKLARRVYGCEMTDAEVGCYLSHLAVYARILESGADAALVLEDDVACAPDFRQAVLDLLETAPDGWSVVRLQSTKRCVAEAETPKGRGEVMRRVGSRELCRLRTSVLGACAYLIRPEACRRMLAAGPIAMPIDQTLDRYWENGIVPYVLRPMPVWHTDAFPSEIGVRGRALHARTAAKSVMRRRAQRLVDGVNKRLFWTAYRVPSVGAALAAAGMDSARCALDALWSAGPGRCRS